MEAWYLESEFFRQNDGIPLTDLPLDHTGSLQDEVDFFQRYAAYLLNFLLLVSPYNVQTSHRPFYSILPQTRT